MAKRESAVQVTIGFNPEDAKVLRDLGGGGTLTAAVRMLLCDGLRWRMRHLTQKPLSTFTLLVTKDSAMIRLAREHADATASELGLRGPLGNRWGFEPTQEAIVAPNTLYKLIERPVE